MNPPAITTTPRHLWMGNIAGLVFLLSSTAAAGQDLGPDVRYRPEQHNPVALLRDRSALEGRFSEGELTRNDQKRLVAARFLAKKTKEALQLARTLVETDPSDLDARQLLGTLLERSGQLDEAETELAVVASERPDDPVIHLDLGIVYRRKANFDLAIEAFRRALAIDPSLAVAHFDIGEALLAKSRNASGQGQQLPGAVRTRYADTAIAEFKKAIELRPDYARPYVALGQIYAELGYMNKAEEALVSAIKQDRKDPDAHYDLGVLKFRRRDYQGAIKSYKTALGLRNNHAEAHNNLGVAFDRVGESEKAIASFQAAVKASPKYVDALFNLGLAYFRKGMLLEARSKFEAVLAIKPDLPEAQFHLGEVFLQTGRTSRALKLYKKALYTRPDDIRTFERLARAHLEQGQPEKAVPYLEKWTKLAPGSGKALATLGLAISQTKRPMAKRDALDLLRQARQLDPEDPEILIKMATVAEAKNLGPEAAGYLLAALELQPTHKQATLALGALYEKTGQNAKARNLFEEALRRRPNFAEAAFRLGTLARRRNDSEMELAFYRKASQLDPSYSEALVEFGGALFSAKRHDEALEQLDLAVERFSRDGELGEQRALAARAYYYRSGALLALEREQEALASARRATELNQSLGKAFVTLGALERKAGNVERALAAYRRAFVLSPDDSDLAFAVQDLEKEAAQQ